MIPLLAKKPSSSPAWDAFLAEDQSLSAKKNSENSQKAGREEVCTGSWLAYVSGMTDGYIRTLREQGIMPEVLPGGKCPRDKSLIALFQFTRGKTGVNADSIKSDKAREQKAKATTEEIKALVATGSAVPADDVEMRWEDAATQVRVVIETHPGLTEQQRADIIAKMAGIKLTEEEMA